jgi:DNA polymerase III epsilon subunit-like protein
MEHTHQIISMKRGETSNSKSPMWRCTTSTGERVNIFQHNDPSKDTAALFREAGYLPDMLALALDQELTWRNHPVSVCLVQDGKWWQVGSVAPRPADAMPDPVFIPQRHLHRVTAHNQAKALFYNPAGFVAFDLETDGTGKDAEIIQVAVIDQDLKILSSSLVKPADPGRAANSQHVTGIAPDQLSEAPTFEEFYPTLRAALDGKIWVIYNAAFDTTVLEFNCTRRNLVPPAPLAVVDAMQIAAWYAGEWNTAHQNYTSMKLQSIAHRFAVDLLPAHNAAADCVTMLAVLKAIAEGE